MPRAVVMTAAIVEDETETPEQPAPPEESDVSADVEDDSTEAAASALSDIPTEEPPSPAQDESEKIDEALADMEPSGDEPNEAPDDLLEPEPTENVVEAMTGPDTSEPPIEETDTIDLDLDEQADTSEASIEADTSVEPEAFEAPADDPATEQVQAELSPDDTLAEIDLDLEDQQPQAAATEDAIEEEPSGESSSRADTAAVEIESEPQSDTAAAVAEQKEALEKNPFASNDTDEDEEIFMGKIPGQDDTEPQAEEIDLDQADSVEAPAEQPSDTAVDLDLSDEDAGEPQTEERESAEEEPLAVKRREPQPSGDDVDLDFDMSIDTSDLGESPTASDLDIESETPTRAAAETHSDTAVTEKSLMDIEEEDMSMADLSDDDTLSNMDVPSGAANVPLEEEHETQSGLVRLTEDIDLDLEEPGLPDTGDIHVEDPPEAALANFAAESSPPEQDQQEQDVVDLDLNDQDEDQEEEPDIEPLRQESEMEETLLHTTAAINAAPDETEAESEEEEEASEEEFEEPAGEEDDLLDLDMGSGIGTGMDEKDSTLIRGIDEDEDEEFLEHLESVHLSFVEKASSEAGLHDEDESAGKKKSKSKKKKSKEPEEEGWYIMRSDGRQEGPLRGRDLRRAAKDGRITIRTKVRHSRRKGWFYAGKVPGMFPKGQEKGKSKEERKKDLDESLSGALMAKKERSKSDTASLHRNTGDILAATSAPPSSKKDPPDAEEKKGIFGGIFKRGKDEKKKGK